MAEQQERLPANMQVSGVPMISLDLNLNSLKSYLDNLTNSVNQHADLINALQNDIQTRMVESQLPPALSSLSDNITLYDNEQIEQLNRIIGKSKKNEKSHNQLDNAINRFSNRIVVQGHGVTQNYLKIEQLEKQILQLQEQVATKAEKEYVKEKHKKLKTRAINEIEDVRKVTEKRDWEIEKRLQEQINTFEGKMGDLEKKTLWKISDMEDIIKRRITEEYVDDSLRVFEERVKRELFQSIQFDSDRIEKIQSDMELKIIQIENNLGEKSKSNKKNIKDVEEALKKLMAKDTFEDFRKQNQSNLTEMQKRLKEIEKKSDFQPLYDRLNNRLKNQEQRMQDLDEELQRKFQELMLRGGGGGSGNGTQVVTNNIDPHKLCQVEADLNRNVKKADKNSEEIQELKEELRQGLEAIGLNIYEQGMSSMNTGKGKLGEFQEKLDELEKKIAGIQNEMGDPNNEVDKFRRVQNDVKALQQKFEGFRDLDRKMNRFFREFDVNSMMKQIRAKAEQEDVLKDFAIMDTKINTNTDNISYLRKDVDNLVVLVRKILNQLQSGTPGSESTTILSTKKLYPVNSLNCLSCGVQRNVPKDQRQGIDGKYYKIDPRYSQTDGINQESLSVSDYLKQKDTGASFLSSQKQLKSSNRPGTAQVTKDSKDKGRILRPGSAKK